MIPYEKYKEIVDVMPILTVDCICIHKGKMLLVKRTNKPLQGHYWLPGGRVLKNETLEQACVRKMKEETGLPVKVTGVAGFHEYIFQENELDVDTMHTLSVVFYVSPLRTDIKLDRQGDGHIWSESLPKEFNIIK